MGTFDAGSIEGRLDLNTSPYTAGLREAQAQADEFEATPIRKRIELDDAEAKAKMDAFAAREDDREIHQRVVIDTAEASAEMDAFRARQAAENLASGGGGSGGGSASSSMGGMFAGLAMPALIGAGLSFAPGLVGMSSNIGLGSIAAGSMFTQFMGATLLMKTLTTEAIKNAQAAAKLTSTPLPKNATKQQRENYAEALQTVKQSQKLINDLQTLGDAKNKLIANPALLETIDKGVVTIDNFLPKLSPLITSLAKGFMPVIDEANRALSGKGFAGFEKFLGNNFRNEIPVWGDSIIKTLGGVGGVMRAVNPEMVQFSKNIDTWAGNFDRWANDGSASKFFADWNRYNAQFRPQLHALAGDTMGALKNLFGTNGLGNPALVKDSIGMIDGLMSTLSHADLKPLRDALTGIHDSETSIGGGISKALPGILELIGSVTKLTSQVNWKLVGTVIGDAATGISKLADGLGVLNKNTNGFLGDLAAAGIIGVVGKKVLGGPIGKFGNFLTGAGGRGSSPANPVFVSGAGVGGGIPGVGGEGGSALDGIKRDLKSIVGAEGVWAALKNAPSIVGARLPGLARVGQLVGDINPELLALTLTGSGGFGQLGKYVSTNKFGGVYSPAQPSNDTWDNRFWSMFGMDDKTKTYGIPASPATYYLPPGSKLTAADVPGINADDMGARLPTSTAAMYKMLQQMIHTPYGVGLTQKNGYIASTLNSKDFITAINGFTAAVKKNPHYVYDEEHPLSRAHAGQTVYNTSGSGANLVLLELGKMMKNGKLTPDANTGKNTVTGKQVPWDTLIKGLQDFAATTKEGRKHGIAGVIDVKAWEKQLGPVFAKSLESAIHPGGNGLVGLFGNLFGGKTGSGAAAGGLGALLGGIKPIGPNLAKLDIHTSSMTTTQKNTNTALAGVHKAVTRVQTSVDHARTGDHTDLVALNTAVAHLTTAINNLAPDIANSVNSANASNTQGIITALRAGHKP